MKIQSTLLLLGLSFGAFAQGTQPTGTANNNLDISNINVTIHTGGDFFCKNPGVYPPNGNSAMSAGFEVPKGSGRHTIFDAALWLGGKDQQDNIYVSSQTYRQGSPPTDGFWPGPIATTQNQAHNNNYDKIWKVSKAQIQNHIANFHKLFYAMPPEIANWPGNGNTANGEAAKLAPFVDVNNDGIYTPSIGDYPDILGDQALYLILNDKGNTKYPNSPSMNAEIHVMYYGFNNPANPAVYNTVFSQYRIINRGQTNFKDVYAGIWTDFDLGNYADDFIGCDTTTNRYYAYNGDNYDNDTITVSNYPSPGSQQYLVNGYGANPPVQSVTFLDKRMSHFLYYNHNQNPVNGYPDIFKAGNFYNYLNGIWKNNAAVTYGGDGTDQNNPPATHMFAGDPVTLNGWSERNTLTIPSSNVPYDRRGIGSIGPFNLNAGQELSFTVAYTFSQGTSNLNSVTQSHTDAIAVQNFFRNAVISGTKPDSEKQPLLLFPNPATDQLTIQLPDRFENEAATIQITDYTGRKVLETLSNSGKNLQLNISSLSKGIYQVSVVSENQRISSKLVKM